jgi:hypothetical protein
MFCFFYSSSDYVNFFFPEIFYLENGSIIFLLACFLSTYLVFIFAFMNFYEASLAFFTLSLLLTLLFNPCVALFFLSIRLLYINYDCANDI